MRTAEERITALHSKMEARKAAHERNGTAAIGAGCVLLAAFLFLMIFGGSPHPGGAAGMYSGAAMLFDDAGGYVLAAVAAFMIGVVVTAAIIGIRKRRADQAEAENAARTAKNGD